MSHRKAKLLHVEQNHGGVDWCRALHYKILINPLTFAKILVRNNPENVARIRRNASKENSEYWIEFADGNIAVVYCRRREAIIVEVSL